MRVGEKQFRTWLLLAVSLSCCVVSFAQAPQPPASGWKLTWSDEFNAPNGTPIDASKWVAEIGGNGWGNHELEYYTGRVENAVQKDGNLVMAARKEDYTGVDGVKRGYTSARLITLGKFDQKYGRFEGRMRVPAGQGMWPAFWMMGSDFPKVNWPTCGEIDIMENVGNEPSVVHGSIHGPGYTGTLIEANYTLPDGRRFSDDFHVFAIEWEPDTIRIYVDEHLYATRQRSELKPDQKWVFDHPFFLLLNVAVGGDWPGSPDANTVFPQAMLVDYVRVYEPVATGTPEK